MFHFYTSWNIYKFWEIFKKSFFTEIFKKSFFTEHLHATGYEVKGIYITILWQVHFSILGKEMIL